MPCGVGGERERTRQLEVGTELGVGTKTMVKPERKALELPALEEQLHVVESGTGHAKELCAAFALGGGSLLAVLFVVRGSSKAARAFRRWEPVLVEYNTVPQNP